MPASTATTKAQSSMDVMQLNKAEMFEKVRASLTPQERRQTQHLLECQEDMLFTWDAKDSCVLAVNLQMVQTKGVNAVKHQVLIPSTPQNFRVERLLCSNDGSVLALAGSRGCALLELPRRWGPAGQFMNGRGRITCRVTSLEAPLFSNNPHLELRQLRWHPASPTDSHLLLLLSDNTIRVYDGETLRHVWQVGPLPTRHTSGTNATVSSALDLGESAVDFDIAPAVKSSDGGLGHSDATNANPSNVSLAPTDTTWNATAAAKDKVEWPLVILRENGNIYILMSQLDRNSPRLQGPITITPQTVDNYGLDYCALLVIPSMPPTLVIAESTGKLHHALLIEAAEAETSFSEIDATLNLYPSEWFIHVLETVELELGMPQVTTDKEAAPGYNCPIHLKRDFINELRYFAFHNAGLHVVSVNFIVELQRFVDSEVCGPLTSLLTPSRAEYVLCTKIGSGERVNAVLGFVLFQTPYTAVLLLGSGQVVSLRLVIDPQLLLLEPDGRSAEDEKASESDSHKQLKTEMEKVFGESFVDHIKSMLKRTVTQPILSLDKSTAPSSQECYDLLSQTIEVLRSEYLERHNLVRAEFAKRINLIQMRKEQQQKDIETLEREREGIREQAHRLAERFEEINDQQELITKKCQDMVRQANTCLPCNTAAEKEFSKSVESFNKTTKGLNMALQKSQEMMNKQWYQMSKVTPHVPLELPEKQDSAIKDILSELTNEIDSQIQDIKLINQALNI